ncbi:MAG: hypothetical protein V4623_01200 [Pseudomonadota bacterium]
MPTAPPTSSLSVTPGARLARSFSSWQGAEIALFLALLSASLWLFNRFYLGIWHDAVVYSLLAARRLHPENFVHDLFFIFGSQDDFNLYTPLFARLVSYLGLDLANQYLSLLGGALWCTSFAVLAWVLFGFSLPMRWLTLFAATLAWSYSPNAQTFILNEAFATARVLAMPLSLLALAADLRDWRVTALGLAVLATLLHPLLGVWALLLLLCRRWRQGYWLAGVLVVVALLAVLPLFLSTPILQPMAEDWAQLVRHSSIDVFFAEPGLLRLDRLLLCVGALCLGARFGQARWQSLYALLALMTVCAYLLSLFCSYYYPISLVMQAQTWRVLWLAMCIGLFAWVDVLWRCLQLGRPAQLLVLLTVLLMYAFSALAGLFFLFCVLLLLSQRAQQWRLFVLAALQRYQGLVVLASLLLLLILLPCYLLDIEIAAVSAMPQGFLSAVDWLSPRQKELLFGFFLTGGFGVGILFWAVLGGLPRWRRLCLLLLLPVLGSAWASWDRRSERVRAQEALYLLPQAEQAGQMQQANQADQPAKTGMQTPTREGLK